jgi:hypothetical protein
MAGYRDRSTYDPHASPNYGRPLWPFNWVQRTGVASGVLGLALYALYFAGRVGWSPLVLDTPMFGLPPLIIGVSLINSRRQELTDPAPELRSARQRWMIIIIALCALILGAATIIEFTRSQ